MSTGGASPPACRLQTLAMGGRPGRLHGVSTAAGERGVAVFDLDGTLLAWDTQVLFCGWVVRRHGWRRLLLAPWLLALPLAPLLGHAVLKRLFLGYLWRIPQPELDALVRGFVAAWFPRHCFPELLDEVGRQRREGRRLVLASASPEWWVAEVGRVLGFDLALGTQVAAGGRVPLFPRLTNHKGRAKVARLRACGIAPPAGRIPASHGYSDGAADLPLLEACEQATVVNPGRRLAAAARRHGWQVVRPALPWRGGPAKGWRFLRAMLGGAAGPAAGREP